jgi:hypothetical protein
VLRMIGVQTCIEYPSWELISPSQGVWNFAQITDRLYMNRQADMKSVFIVGGWRTPKWLPHDWFVRQRDGMIDRQELSLWNEEAQQFSDQYYQTLVDNFKAEDVLFILGEFQGGEGVYPPSACFYDRCALEDYHRLYGAKAIPDINTEETRNWFGQKIIEYHVRKQGILYQQHKEIWNMQQRLMDIWSKAFGNFVIPETFQALQDKYPDIKQVFAQFTYYDEPHYEIDNEQFVDMIKTNYNCDVIVEAHFCSGLKETTPKSIAKGFRGQICCPTHPQAGMTLKLEPWMIDEVAKAHQMWLESKQ